MRLVGRVVRIGLLAGLAVAGGAAGGSATGLTAEQVCSQLSDRDSLPTRALEDFLEATENLESGGQGSARTAKGIQNPGCMEVVRCLLTAREEAKIVSGGQEAAVEADTVCDRLSGVTAATEAEIRDLAVRLEGEDSAACRGYLECVAEAKGGSTSALSVATGGEERGSSKPTTIAPDQKAEFDRICAQVPRVSSLTDDEIRQLIADCDSLIETLSNSGAPWAKVFIHRLKMCHSFFEYTLETSEPDEDDQNHLNG